MTSPLPRQKIRELREAKGLSLQQAADLAGYSKAYVQKIETGERDLRDEALARIADALGVDVEEIDPAAAARRAEVEAELAHFLDATITRLQVYKRRLTGTQEPKGEQAA